MTLFKKKRIKLGALLIGVAMAFFIGLAIGLVAGFIVGDAWVGAVVGAVLFGFSLDVLFNGGYCE